MKLNDLTQRFTFAKRLSRIWLSKLLDLSCIRCKNTMQLTCQKVSVSQKTKIELVLPTCLHITPLTHGHTHRSPVGVPLIRQRHAFWRRRRRRQLLSGIPWWGGGDESLRDVEPVLRHGWRRRRKLLHRRSEVHHRLEEELHPRGQPGVQARPARPADLSLDKDVN